MAVQLTNSGNGLSANTSSSRIIIRNLQLPHGVVAPDIWNKPKEQPALITLTLQLKTDFKSAADADKLDDSTIHYGELAKLIRNGSKAGQTYEDVMSCVESAIGQMGKKKGGFIVAWSKTEVLLPKASMFGEGVVMVDLRRYHLEDEDSEVEKEFRVEDVKIMTLIGVNGYERMLKQPLVANISLFWRSDEGTMREQTPALFKLEQTLVQIIQDSSFETLETLADFAVSRLRTKLLDAELPDTRVQFRIEKPRAIAFADAPAVEIIRDVPQRGNRSSSSPVTSVNGKEAGRRPAGSQTGQLSIIRPYSD